MNRNSGKPRPASIADREDANALMREKLEQALGASYECAQVTESRLSVSITGALSVLYASIRHSGFERAAEAMHRSANAIEVAMGYESGGLLETALYAEEEPDS